MQEHPFPRTSRSIALLGAAAGVLMICVGILDAAYAAKPTKPPVFDPVLVYQRDGDLIVADASGQNKAVVHQLIGSGTAAWSPDGTQIVFVDRSLEKTTACEAASPGLFVLDLLNAQGKLDVTATPVCLVELSEDLIEFNSPAWSSLGIVYSDLVQRLDGSSDWDLFLIESEGDTDPINLSNNPNFDEIEPSWSYDGNRLVFVTTPSDGSFGTFDLEVATVDLLSDPPRLLRTSILPGTPLGNAKFIDTPDWSNYSNLIAVVAELPGQHKSDIWIIDIDQNNSAIDAWNLTEELTFGRGLPSWSGDDSMIVLFSDVENTCSFKRKDSNGWQLAIIPSDIANTQCVDAFIGPPGTNTRLNFPRSLDWLR